VNLLALVRVAIDSPERSVLSNLWAEVATELCNEFAYAASQAGLHCGFQSHRSGVEIDVSGYNDKASVLLQRICRTVTDELPKQLSENVELFGRIRDKLEQKYSAVLVAQPYQHAGHAADLCLEVGSKWPIHDRLVSLQAMTAEDLLHFSKYLLSRFQLEVLVHGNVTASEALQLTNIVLEAWEPKPPLHVSSQRVVQLPAAESIYRSPGWNDQDDNSCVINLWEIGQVDTKTNAILSLVRHLVREPAFNTLRTEEQLGYIVFTNVKTSGNDIKSLMFLIQSDAYDPIHMDERIEAFLVLFRTKLVSMSADEFRGNVDAVCEQLLEIHKNLGEESSQHWSVITNRSYRFHRLREIAAAARRVSRQEALQFFDRYLLASSPHRRKLSVQIFGAKHVERQQKEAVAKEGAVVIEDPSEFGRHQWLFPSPKTVSLDSFMLQVEN
jgi:insulysin